MEALNALLMLANWVGLPWSFLQQYPNHHRCWIRFLLSRESKEFMSWYLGWFGMDSILDITPPLVFAWASLDTQVQIWAKHEPIPPVKRQRQVCSNLVTEHSDDRISILCICELCLSLWCSVYVWMEVHNLFLWYTLCFQITGMSLTLIRLHL